VDKASGITQVFRSIADTVGEFASGPFQAAMMALTHEDRDWIKAGLEKLYDASAIFAGVNRQQVREHIDVGEYGLALDDLAGIHLKTGKPVPADIVQLFDALAMKMGMKQGDGWQAVAEIRAAV